MRKLRVNLNEINKVQAFVKVIGKCDFDTEIISGRYVIDAKSIMGVFSLDLSKPLTLVLNSDDNKKLDSITNKLINMGIMCK